MFIARALPDRYLRAGLRRRRCGRGTLGLLGLLTLGLAGRSAGRWALRTRGQCGDRSLLAWLFEERVEFRGLERFLRDQLLHDEVELVAVLREHLVRALPRALDDVVDLGVDDLRDLFGVVPLLLDLTAEEDELVATSVLKRAELLAHAELRDHLPSHLGRLLDVVARTGRGVATQVELLGDPAAEGRGDVVLEFPLGPHVAVLLRERPRHAHGHAAGDDRDLVHRIGVLEQLEAEGVAGLVVGHDPFLFLGDDARTALGTKGDLLERLLEVDLADGLFVATRGEDRGLVHDVRQVGAGEAGRDLRDPKQLHVLVERLAADVHVEDRAAALDVGAIEHDLAVEAAGPQERRVEDVRTVRGGDDDDVGAGVEAVHLDQDLVQGLLALVVRAAEAGATLAADRVDL